MDIDEAALTVSARPTELSIGILHESTPPLTDNATQNSGHAAQTKGFWLGAFDSFLPSVSGDGNVNSQGNQSALLGTINSSVSDGSAFVESAESYIVSGTPGAGIPDASTNAILTSTNMSAASFTQTDGIGNAVAGGMMGASFQPNSTNNNTTRAVITNNNGNNNNNNNTEKQKQKQSRNPDLIKYNRVRQVRILFFFFVVLVALLALMGLLFLRFWADIERAPKHSLPKNPPLLSDTKL